MKLGRGISLELKNFFYLNKCQKGGPGPGLVNLKAPVEGRERAPGPHLDWA